MDPAKLVALLAMVNPSNTPGRVAIIVRMGAAKLREKFPALIEAVQAAGACSFRGWVRGNFVLRCFNSAFLCVLSPHVMRSGRLAGPFCWSTRLAKSWHWLLVSCVLTRPAGWTRLAASVHTRSSYPSHIDHALN